jgi:hypothetical protein
MIRRIGLWAFIGLVVACCWMIVGTIAGPGYNLGRSTLVAITAPASLLGRRIPLGFYWFILLNAGTYALVGIVAEGLHPRHR